MSTLKIVIILLNRPVISSNRGFGITPMEQGLKSGGDS